jgi:pyridoxal phosphate enzyme (YggS family)
MILPKIDENLRKIRSCIEAAAQRVHRDPDSVKLVAVTKYAEPAWVQALFDLGHRDLGESRPQQLARRAEEFPGEIRWHLIGHLQRNKVDLVLPVTTQIHSVDSLRLLKRIGESSVQAARPRSVLLEVNVSGEEAKDGLTPSGLRELWPQFCEQPGVQIDGLMTMAPHTNDPESTRATFRGLRELRDELAESSQGERPLPELSMGMSGDFEVAIEEGATLVRVGSSLYEGLSRE